MRLHPLLLLAPLVFGCTAKPAPALLSLGGPSGSCLWTDDPKGVPGLDSGGCYYKGQRLLVWADDASAAGGDGRSSSDGLAGVKGDGRFLTRAGREVAFKYHITGEKTGAVVIDSVEYDLARGNVFLLKTGGEKPVVKQIDKDLSGVDLGSPNFRAIGRADPAIVAFFQPPK
jgi:hypothetical protein